MSSLIVLALLVVLLAELVAACFWYATYFRIGLVVYRKVLQRTSDTDTTALHERLTERFRGGIGPSLMFHELAPGEIAFREACFELRFLTYTPVMHGLLRLPPQSHLVKVEGRASWFIIAFSASVVGLVAAHLDAWPMLPFLAAILASIYFVQARSYGKVARFVADGAPDVALSDHQLRRWGQVICRLMFVALLLGGTAWWLTH